MEAFQKAVEATLKKRLQQAEEELDFLRKENVYKHFLGKHVFFQFFLYCSYQTVFA